MSDPRLAAISAALSGVPEDLIERSAAARAQAQGVDVADVLGAWSGGAAIEATPAPAPVTATAPAPGEAVTPSPAPVETPAEPTATPSPEVASAPVISAEVPAPEVPDEDPIEPAGLSQRMRVGAKVGALLGGLAGFMALLVTAPALLNRLGLPAGESTPAIEVTPLAAVLVIAGMSAVFGVVITLSVRGLAAFISPAYAASASPRSSTMLGALIGLALGFIAGGIVIGPAETTLAGTKLLGVRTLVFTVLAGGVVLGAIAGAVAQALVRPAALIGEAGDDADTVQRRLSDSMMIPLSATVIIAVIVVSLGSLLVRYPSYAPVLAILVSIGILAFASLMASRPNLRISRGEVLLAAAGVGVVLLMLALIAAQTSSSDHGGEATHSMGVERSG